MWKTCSLNYKDGNAGNKDWKAVILKQLYVIFVFVFLPWNISFKIILMVHWHTIGANGLFLSKNLFWVFVNLVSRYNISQNWRIALRQREIVCTAIHCNYNTGTVTAVNSTHITIVGFIAAKIHKTSYYFLQYCRSWPIILS